MNWLLVMTLPDGTTSEMPMPSPDDTSQDDVHGYRVRGSKGVTEFATLREVADHLVTPHADDQDPDPGPRKSSEHRLGSPQGVTP